MRALSEDHYALPVIAIVGGGASGTLTAVQLLRHAAWQRTPLRIALIDRHGRHGLGQAYSTEHRAQLLNTMAFQTSALPEDPDHLVRWAGVPPETFLPRPVYGQYLRDTLARAEQQALPHARLVRISAEVTSVSESPAGPAGPVGAAGLAGRAVRLATAGGALDADLAVLALGNPAAGLPFAAPDSDRIIADPWYPGALDRITDGLPVVIIGTGLTMTDLAVAIAAQSPESAIFAISRHGLLPRPHPGTAPRERTIWLPAIHTAPEPVRLAELMSQVRAAVAIDPAGWYDVVTAMRPHLRDLWYRLPDADKQVFLRRVARYWEVHRHLLPPPTARRIAALQSSGQLSVLSGRVTEVTETGAGMLSVRLDSGRAAVTSAGDHLTAGWIINAAGAPADLGATGDPLLRCLFASGEARPDPMRLGLDATTYGAIIDASGAVSETLYTLGPPLRGLWYETTSMPEIRVQAAALARRIAADRRISRPGGRAA